MSPLARATKPLGMVDLHTHLAAHLSYGFMLYDGTPESLPVVEPSYNHTFQQQVFTDWIKKSGIKLFVNAALANVFSFDSKSAK